MEMNVEGKSGRGRPMNSRIDKIENDMKIAGVNKEEVEDSQTEFY
jgi:hypothetical protein